MFLGSLTIQNTAARFTLCLIPFTHISSHRRKLHWLSIANVHSSHYLHKQSTTQFEHQLSEQLHQLPHHLQTPLLSRPQARHCLTQLKTRALGHAFSYLDPKAWNILPIQIRAANLVLEFRIELKTWPFM